MDNSSKSESIELDSIFDDINVILPEDSFYKPQIISEYELLTLMDDTFSTLSNWYLKLKSKQTLTVGDGLVLVGTCNNQAVETAYVARARNKNIQTVDGKCWLLKGEMDMVQMLISGEPNLEQFQNGFPSNWKEVISILRDKQLKEEKERVALAEVDMELESDDETTVKKIQQQMDTVCSKANTLECTVNTNNQNSVEKESLSNIEVDPEIEATTIEHINCANDQSSTSTIKPGLDRADTDVTLLDEPEKDLDEKLSTAEKNTVCEAQSNYCEEIVSEGTTHFEEQIPLDDRDDLVQELAVPRKKTRKKKSQVESTHENHVYMSPPRSAHESVKSIEESVHKRSNSDSEDELLKSATTKKKKPRKPQSVPSTPVKSRSGRTIIKPLQYWKNEKANLTIVDEQGEKQFQLVVLK
ncbi:hypothetical protein HDV06_007151 [Boothiomyces sp. JEL0866]|nr:hypothetical protein HDV06_007151 [Boothiomyces sp. JEL0866]